MATTSASPRFGLASIANLFDRTSKVSSSRGKSGIQNSRLVTPKTVALDKVSTSSISGSEWSSGSWETDDDESSSGSTHYNSDEVLEEPPANIFGRKSHVDPILRAIDLQDKAGIFVTSLAGEGREGRALSQATSAWLATHEGRRRLWTDFVSNRDEPCAVCNATREDAVRSVMDKDLGFCSSLNLKYNDSEQYAWSFGHRYIVIERQYWSLRPDQLPPEVWAARLLRKYTTVPVPEVVAAWKEGQVAITITERARGWPLAQTWYSLSEDKRHRIAEQVADFVKQWRKMTSAKISSLDEGPYLYPDHLIGGSAGHSVYFKDESQYREHVRRRFESQGWDDTITNLAMRLMPMNEPFVFTHGNLTLNSIFVYGTKVTAIVGLDKAAYLPVWAESLAIHFAHGPAERQWKALLFGYVGYEQIKSYWDVCQDLLVASFKGVQGATESGKRETIQALLATMVEQKEHRESEAAKQVIQSKQNGLMQEVDEGGVQRPTQSEGNNEKPKEDRMSSQSKQTKTDHSSNNEKMLSEKTTNLVIMSDSSTQTDKPTTPRPLSQRPLSHVFRMKTARKDLQVQGQPFTPRPIAARRKPSVFHAASGTQAQNYYPNGFSVLDKKGEGLKCALEAIYDSFTAQYPERRGEISLRSLGLQFLSIKQPQIGVTVGAEYFLEKLAKTLQAWGRSLSEPLDLQLGCILIDGREWLDPSSDGANSGTKAIWITNVNADGIMTFKSAEDFRGLAPNRGKLGVASDSEISPTKIGSKGSIVQGLIDVTGEVDGTDFKVTGIDSGDRQTQNISEMSEVHGNDDNDVQTMPFETRDL